MGGRGLEWAGFGGLAGVGGGSLLLLPWAGEGGLKARGKAAGAGRWPQRP
jgi:hypothetical protein